VFQCGITDESRGGLYFLLALIILDANIEGLANIKNLSLNSENSGHRIYVLGVNV